MKIDIKTFISILFTVTWLLPFILIEELIKIIRRNKNEVDR